MIRETVIEIYLFIIKVLFAIFNLFPLQNKVTFVATFKENPLAVYEEMNRVGYSGKTVFLCKKGCYLEIKRKVAVPVYTVESGNPIHLIVSIYHLATSKHIIVDNYYGFLASARFKKDVECIQIWHAGGAVKTFGLRDASNGKRLKRANKRFRQVYERFDKVVAGSSAFAKIFREAFGLPEDRMLPIGFPRTDFFYDKEKLEKARTEFFQAYPMLKRKKRILYAPTYRSGGNGEIAINITKMYERLKNDYVLLIRLHPSVSAKVDVKYDHFVYDFSNYPNVNDLLIIADVLITDYSSIPFEFALLEKPMIFYPYDLLEYVQERGLWEPYEQTVPGPIARSTDEILFLLEKNVFDMQKVKEFAQRWNEYTPGSSSHNFVRYLFLSDLDKRKSSGMMIGKQMPMD